MRPDALVDQAGGAGQQEQADIICRQRLVGRLKPGGEVRLKYACIIKLDEIVKDAAGAITRLRDGLTLFVDNPGKLEAAVENNPGMKRSALETVDLLRNAAATGAEKGRAPEAERKAPELDRSMSKRFDMGL